MNFKPALFLCGVVLWSAAMGLAQTPVLPVSATPEVVVVPQLMTGAAAAALDPKPVDYKLGVGDMLLIRASNVPELSEKQFRIDPNGAITGQMIGRVPAAGLTLGELENAINKKLGVFLQQPDAAVSVMEYQSQPVSLFGEVTAPGVHQLQGRKTLVEMLAIAGGVRIGAGPIVIVSRKIEYGRVPLPDAKDDATGKFSVGTLQLKPLVAGQSPDKDIVIMPNDIISVPRAELVYVAGDVTHSGPLSLTDKPTLSVLEALSATGGVTKTADTKKAHILRMVPGSATREQVPVNLARIMTGKANDQQMVAGDILVVPPSSTKKAAQRALEIAIQMGTVIVSSGLVNGSL